MTENERISFVIKKIIEESQTSSNPLIIRYEFTPVSSDNVSADDELKILKKFEREGNLLFPGAQFIWMAMPGQEATKINAIIDKEVFDDSISKGFIELKLRQDFLKESKKEKAKNNLKSAEIRYVDNEAVLEIGSQRCQIPPYKNEHYFCRAMYEHGVNEPIDWSTIYEKITGYYKDFYGEPSKTRENWRVVYDAMEALNNRIKKCMATNDDLFTWQEKTIKRNY